MRWVCVCGGVDVEVCARRVSGAGRAILVRGPCGLPCGARAGRGLAKLGYASDNASPDPPGPARLSHAQGIAQPTSLARLGGLGTVAGSQQLDFLAWYFLLFF